MVRRRGAESGDRGCVGIFRFTPPAEGEKWDGTDARGDVSGENRYVAVRCVSSVRTTDPPLGVGPSTSLVSTTNRSWDKTEAIACLRLSCMGTFSGAALGYAGTVRIMSKARQAVGGDRLRIPCCERQSDAGR